jgi:hypothetical protein
MVVMVFSLLLLLMLLLLQACLGRHLPQPPAGQEGGCAAAGAARHCR